MKIIKRRADAKIKMTEVGGITILTIYVPEEAPEPRVTIGEKRVRHFAVGFCIRTCNTDVDQRPGEAAYYYYLSDGTITIE